MRKRVELELLSPLMCGGMRIADNFLESEPFIRGSVLRAAFANLILLECPLADKPGKNGELNFVDEKDPDGVCADCPKKAICRAFSDMYFSFAYPDHAIPAPFTLKGCKTAGLKHRMQDTVFQNGRLQCSDCNDGLKRMESVKGLIKEAETESGYAKVPIETVLTTHTAINYDSHTAEEGRLFTVRAIPKGTVYTAEIDDCDSGMLSVGNIIYVGKYASAGYGKVLIRSVADVQTVTEERISTDIAAFQKNLAVENKAALLFRSDAILAIPVNHSVLSSEEYRAIWQKAMFGAEENAVIVEKVFAETQLYSGYCTGRKWGEWKDSEPVLQVKKGTSVLLEINDMQKAISVLTKLAVNGVGKRTNDGFGEVIVCHPLHRLGVIANDNSKL
ncbi:MAG: hypothetical protein J6P20_02665 [Oscillospiraceae bacterium]|nr:hypothetical protein [Oscillospiraceae bacterium]